MTTSELIERLAARLNVSRAESRRLVNGYLAAIVRNLSQGRSVVLQGFGTFAVRRTKPRRAYLPSAKRKMLIPAHRQPHFKPAAKLREAFREWQARD